MNTGDLLEELDRVVDGDPLLAQAAAEIRRLENLVDDLLRERVVLQRVAAFRAAKLEAAGLTADPPRPIERSL